jgi:hypothetical protein
MTKRRVRVETSGLERRRARLWAYGYADLARLFGMTEGSLRQAVARGRLDPTSLESVMAFAAKRRSLQRGSDGAA